MTTNGSRTGRTPSRLARGAGLYGALILAVCLGLALGGCTASREQTKSPRGPIEQLLLSRSIVRSLAGLRVPLLEGATVFMETEGLPPDLSYVKALVAAELGLAKSQIRQKKEDAQFLVTVIVHSMGTEQGHTLVGMPPIQGGLFPIALPELALYKADRQIGHARFSLAIYETATGKLRATIPWRAGSAFYHYYTVFFIFAFPSTDLVLPPTPDSEFSHTLERTTTAFMGEEEDEEP